MVSEAVEETEKEKTCKPKTNSKQSPQDVIKEILKVPDLPQSVTDTVKNIDLENEFDGFKVAINIIQALEATFTQQVDFWTKPRDAFDALLSGEKRDDSDEPGDQPQDTALLELCLHVFKVLSHGIPDLSEILLKFKQSLIKCVINDKLADSIRNEASLVCERLLEKDKFIVEEIDNVGHKWIRVYLYVIKRALAPGANKCDVKRVWSLKKLLTLYNVIENSSVLELVKSTIISHNFLACKEGRQFIGYFLSLDKTLVSCLNGKIKEVLPSIAVKSKSHAVSYGEIYYMAWNQALPEIKQELEDEVIQRWMELYLKLDRPNYLSAAMMGKVIFRILSHLHNSRRSLLLSSAITRLYQPILWRSLASHHALERCNAAELFLDVFPLEKPGGTVVQNSNFKEKQFKQIMELLKDESHYVRIITVKGLSPVFQRRMDCLSNEQCREILCFLTNSLANDGSSYLVRAAVWDFFSSLVQSDDSTGFLTMLLPLVTNHFHDTSEQVRKAFTLMLLHISRSQHLNISYTDVAPMAHIIARLSLEGETVGKLLAKLIMPTVYTEGMDVLGFVSKLRKLILKCPQAADNLCRWAPHVVSLENANFMMTSILVYLRAYANKKVEGRPDGSGKSTCKPPEEAAKTNLPSVDQDEENSNLENVQDIANQESHRSPSASPMKKKQKKSKRHSPVLSESNQEGGEKEGKVDVEPATAETHAHLLSCAYILWMGFSPKLTSEPEITNNLNAIVTNSLQNFLRCYKGTPAWYASLTLASMVPVTKLSGNTTASSTCLAELRRCEKDTPNQLTEILVFTLTAWNRGYEIMELAIDYIDPAFKLFHLNSSAFLSVKEGKGKGRVVRFVKDSGKQLIGVNLLKILFYDYHNETRLLLNHYDRIYELYNYLASVKVIIETTLGEGLNQESKAVLTDEFVLKCFELYVQLLTTLDRSEVPDGSEVPAFSSTHHMISLIEWTTSIIIPKLSTIKSPEDIEENQQNDSSNDSDVEDEDNKKKRKKKKKTKNQKKVGSVKEDFLVSCLKCVVSGCTFMVSIKMVTRDFVVAAVQLALTLIQSDQQYWFLEGCLQLVESLAEHTRAWMPTDDDQIMSTICPSLYSYLLIPITSNPALTNDYLRKYNCDLGFIRRKIFSYPSIVLAMYGTNHNNFSKVFDSIIESSITALHVEAKKIESIDTGDKVEDLPFGVSVLTQAIMNRVKLIPLIIPAINDFILRNKEDGVLVLCAISYLYTLIKVYESKFERSVMVSSVQDLHPIVSDLSNEAEQPGQEDDDSFFMDPLAKLDVKKIGLEILQNLADTLNCQVVRPALPVVVVTDSELVSRRSSVRTL